MSSSSSSSSSRRSVLLPFTFFSETNTTKLSMHGGKDRSLLQPRMKTE